MNFTLSICEECDWFESAPYSVKNELNQDSTGNAKTFFCYKIYTEEFRKQSRGNRLLAIICHKTSKLNESPLVSLSEVFKPPEDCPYILEHVVDQPPSA